MSTSVHSKRVREQNRQFLVGHRAHPSKLKRYRNIKPASFFAKNEKAFAGLDKKEAKLETELKKVRAAREQLAKKIKTAVTTSRAAARLTLKSELKVLKDFVGGGKK